MDAAEVVDLIEEDGQVDPHFWQDPERMASPGRCGGEATRELDPDNSSDYLANAAALRSDLESLDAEFATGLANCERNTIVVSHDAFEYLAKYGLQIESIVGSVPGSRTYARRPRPACATLIAQRRRHHRLLRDAGEPGPGRDVGIGGGRDYRRTRPDRRTQRRDRERGLPFHHAS